MHKITYKYGGLSFFINFLYFCIFILLYFSTGPGKGHSYSYTRIGSILPTAIYQFLICLLTVYLRHVLLRFFPPRTFATLGWREWNFNILLCIWTAGSSANLGMHYEYMYIYMHVCINAAHRVRRVCIGPQSFPLVHSDSCVPSWMGTNKLLHVTATT